MKFYILKDKKLADKKAFSIIKKQIIKKPALLIGLAVGKTTDSLYKLISKDAKKNPSVWKKIKLFQIDENIGIPPDSPISFNFEIRKELSPLFKILPKKNCFLIDGFKKPKETIKEAYSFIRKNKGIDLIILGLGPNYDPHIAYNTTGKSNLNSTFRVVKLHPNVARNAKAKYGITIGIKEILECKKVLLIAYGKDKAKSIKLAFSGKVNMKRASASALQLHKALIVLVDKNAVK